jgi:hypothetical protein
MDQMYRSILMRLIGRFLMVAVVMSCAGLAQAPHSARLSPVPLYPPDGQIPEVFKEQFVFLDAETSDLVLAYPPVGPLGRSTGASTRTVRRLELPRHVLPTITASVVRTQGGAYQYTYLVGNGPGARQAIGRWFLPVPAPKAPDPLALTSAAAAVGQGDGWKWSHFSFRPGEWAIQWESDAKRRLSSGPPASFVVTDRIKPGIVQAYVQGHVPAAGLPIDMPQAALIQLGKFQQFEFSSVVVLTIGPKFEPNTAKLIIAGDFHSVLSRLVGSGALSGDSPFVKQSLAQLEEFLSRPRAENAALSSIESFPPLSQKPRFGFPLEEHVFSAMRLALEF